MASATHWRVNITQNDGSTYTSIAELEFRATSGGADQATGGTAFDGGNTGSAEDASKAFDNDTATQWAVLGTTGSVGYSWASAVTVTEVAITAKNTVGTLSPRDFSIEHSNDGSTWTVAWSVTGSTGWAAGETRVFTQPAATDARVYTGYAEALVQASSAELSARTFTTYAEVLLSPSNATISARIFTGYVEVLSSVAEPPPPAGTAYKWRLLLTAGNAGSYCTIGEVQFRATSGGVDLCDSLGGVATSSSIYGGGYEAPKGFDNSTGTAWSKGTSDSFGSAWLQFDLNSPSAVTEMTLQAATFWANEMPNSWDVQYWDGATWVTAWSVSGQTAWAAGELRTFTAPGATRPRRLISVAM